jgi:hypothetical protein
MKPTFRKVLLELLNSSPTAVSDVAAKLGIQSQPATPSLLAARYVEIKKNAPLAEEHLATPVLKAAIISTGMTQVCL